MRAYPAYKQSKLDWVGRIPDFWDERRARFLFQAIDERSQTGNEELLSVSHITGVTPRSEKTVTMFMAESYEGHKLCAPGDLVVNSLWAWMAALGVSRHRGIVSSAYHVYRQKDPNTFNPKFLDYLLRTRGYAGEYLCRSKGIWTSRLLLTPSDFFDIPILLPPRSEQDAIVAFLEAKEAEIQKFIDNQRQKIELLKEYKATSVNDTFRNGLRMEAIPVRRLVSFITSGSRSWAAYYSDDGPIFVQSGNLGRNLGLNLTAAQRVQPPESSEGLRTRVKMDDVLVCITGALTGNVVHVESEPPEAYINQHVALLRPKPSSVAARYLAYALWSGVGQDQFRMAQYGGTKQGLGLQDVLSVAIPKIAVPEQARLVRMLDTLSDEVQKGIRAAQQQIEQMQEYRTALIAAAVTGKVDVRNGQLEEGL